MTDSQEQMRQAAREVGRELTRVIDQATRLARQAGEDLGKLVGDPRPMRPGRKPDSPAELIREVGRLRDEGLITEDEFQAKKADLLARL